MHSTICVCMYIYIHVYNIKKKTVEYGSNNALKWGINHQKRCWFAVIIGHGFQNKGFNHEIVVSVTLGFYQNNIYL